MNDIGGSAAEGLVVDRTNMPFKLDGGIAPQAAIGLIVLASDHTVEYEFRQIMGGLDGVAYYESRIQNDPTITPETLAQMEARIADCTAVILPGVPLDVVAYGCTSGAMVIGEENVFARIHEARPEVACTTPMTAASAAFRTLGVHRIGLLTPYLASINHMMRDHLLERGFEVPVMGSFNHNDDNEVARIDAESVGHAVRELGREPSVDAVFVSCTSLRVAAITEALEAEIGKPVTASNPAMAWHCLRLAGYDAPVPGFGQLLDS